MKKLLPTLIACILSFGLISFGLNKYGHQIFGDINKTTNALENQQNNPANNTNEELDEYEDESDEPEVVYTTNIDGKELEKDYKNWKTYNKDNIELSFEFKSIDIDNTEITKEDFLNKLKTGLYIPLKANEGDFTYKLHKLSESANEKIGRAIRGLSSIAYQYFKKEGTQLPTFKFTDLNGNIYNKSNTEGKIKVIKCWFINCVVCVQEFPELNELYDKYESNDNVVFLSLAFDKADNLKSFLSKKEFRFPVIPEQKDYMKGLEIKQYPTHIIVDEDNNIIKMVNNVEALITIVDYLIGSQEIIEEENF